MQGKSPFTNEQLIQAASKYTRLKDFREGSPREYDCLRKRDKNLFMEATANMIRTKRLWDKDEIISAAKKSKSPTEFMTKYQGAYCAAKTFGKEFYNSVHSIIPKTRRDNLTDEDIIALASKYSSIVDLQKNDSSLYHMIRARGGKFKEIAFAGYKKERTFWDSETLLKEAKKYNSKAEYEHSNPKAYYASLRKGLEFHENSCGHMGDGRKTDADAIYIWSVVGFDCIYKIGLTSKRLNKNRIVEVAGHARVDYEIVLIEPKNKKLYDLEKIALSFGTPARVKNKSFNGSSEFRELTEIELNELKCLIREW
jgi:hypothetical protein